MSTRRTQTIRGSDIEKNEALYDGIKPWMRNAARDWLQKQLIYTSSGSTYYRTDAITTIELSGRINIGALKYDSWRYDALVKLLESHEDYGLDIIQTYIETGIVTGDLYGKHISHVISPNVIDSLNSILIRGGSKWKVVVNSTKATIEARVDETTENAFKKLSESQDDYANLLKQAWAYCYGREPKPSEAYTYAIKAVEAVSWRVITPKNRTATLGTLIVDLDTKNKNGKVTTIFKDKKAGSSVDMMIQDMRRLWQGHSDRHATGVYVEPNQVEAEVAIHLAILLCHLFKNNSITVV